MGAIMAGFYMIWLMNKTPVAGSGLLFIVLYLWVFFTTASYFLWTRFLEQRLRTFSTHWKAWWLLGCAVAGFWLTDNIPVVLPNLGAWRLVLFFCAGIGLGALLFVASIYFAARFRRPSPVRRRPFRWLLYALPMIAAWVVVLLAFWPGMMSADSLDQWGQALSGQFNNHHPAFHTFTIWLLTRIVQHPAVVALAQIVMVSLVCGAVLAYFETLGISPRWLWIAAFVIALSPVNATMVNTLWKDIPYSAAMLGFTALIFGIAHSKGGLLARKGAWLILGITAALAALFRHNGLPVVVGSFLVLLVVFRRQWQPVAAAFAVCLVLYFGITGPVYRLIGVQQSTALVEAASSIYRVAATADPDSQAEDVLESMNPISNTWQCSILNTLMQANRADGTGQRETYPQLLGNLIQHAPRLLAFDYRCNRSLVWIVWDPNGEVRNPSHAEYGIDANNYGLVSNSRIPQLRFWLSEFVRRTAYDPSINWLLWRPALYLYGFLFALVLTTTRHKNPAILLAGVPILIESIGSTLITMPPNFRYHYFVYLLALAFWPLLFFSPGLPETEAANDEPAESTAL